MATFALTESEEFEVIPADTILEVEVVNCELKETPFLVDDNDPSKGKKEQISFRFKVTEPGEWSGRTLFGNTPTTFTSHPDCKLRAWVQELLGMNTLPAGFEFDTENLIGLTAKAIVGNRARKAADGTEVLKDYVDAVMRVDAGLDFADDVF